MIDPRARLLLIINVGLLAVTFERPLLSLIHISEPTRPY